MSQCLDAALFPNYVGQTCFTGDGDFCLGIAVHCVVDVCLMDVCYLLCSVVNCVLNEKAHLREQTMEVRKLVHHYIYVMYL